MHSLSQIFQISSTAGAVGMAHEHLAIAVALNVPFFIVITKIDLVQPTSTLQSLESFLKQVGSRRVPLIIRNLDDVITAGANQLTENVVPIFCVSSVSGEGLELLLRFLHVLPPGISTKEKERLEQVKKITNVNKKLTVYFYSFNFFFF